MIVDDRLDTVLRTQPGGRAGQVTQLRQLIDILGRTADADWGEAHQRGLAQIDALHLALGDAGAAAAIAQCVARSPRLITHLATHGPRTALAVIGCARLDEAQWLGLVPRLAIQARGALRHRRDLSTPVIALLDQLGIDDFVLSGPVREPVVTPEQQPVVETAPAPPQEPETAATPTVTTLVPRSGDAMRRSDPAAGDSIGAIVRRIEEFRRHRDDDGKADAEASTAAAAERSPDAPQPSVIDIAIDGAGVIVAADGVDPALVVGHTPFAAPSAAAAACVDPDSLMAARARQPVVAGTLMLDGAAAIAGSWRIDAVPRFGVDGGQFGGYRARLRRIPVAPVAVVGQTGGDALQQVLHELRTPINAIQGFAELIQSQVLGPTPHQYRSLAASIAADAARMLAGFEDIERLALLESGRVRITPGEADFAAIMARLVAQLDPLIGPREIRLRATVPTSPLVVAIAAPEAERIAWRLSSTLVSAAAPGERLALSLDHSADGSTARLILTLPFALALRDDDALFSLDAARGSGGHDVGMLGHGFALRLVAAEVAAADGHLDRSGGAGSAILTMTLPLAIPVAQDRYQVAS